MSTQPVAGGQSASARRSDDELIAAALRQEGGSHLARAPMPRLPEKIGPYKIIRRIGAGGMGVVYEAEQSQPARRVALKVTRTPAGAGARHTRLFQREIEVLGRLRHPSIARIYDAGDTDDGQQYFVMELIEGRPLREYCELADLSLRDCLGLFSRICAAVNYAHQRGVIHRDLKPANILVDDEGVPHVLDFGLGRFIDPEMEVTRSLLEGQALIGTLPYMSPEQATADAGGLDVRTDVYSLGVILYEMLTGRYPYDVGCRLADALRNIAEAEPARPSSIRRKLNDEVDTIILRALAKDRERRYQSAEALGEDVRRYLAGEAIEAKRDSGWYVFRKLAASHRYASAVAVLLAVIVFGFGVVSSRFYLQARAALEQQRLSEENTRMAYHDMDGFMEGGRNVLRQSAFGWFLLEWREGRVERAREIQAKVSRSSPEYAAMSFLLDESQTVETLRGHLPESAGALLHFVVGERCLKAGRTEEAIAEFKLGAAAREPQYEWFRRSAAVRAEQLGGRVSAATRRAEAQRRGK